MKEYTFMFMNVHKKHTIYGKGDEDQRGTIRTLPKMVKTNENMNEGINIDAHES